MTNMELITQPSQMLSARIHLLDADLNRVGAFQGNILSMSISFDNTSATRRTMSLSLASTEAKGVLEEVESFWISKIVQVEYGIYDHEQADTVWFLLGTFVAASLHDSFGVGTAQVDLTLLDLMSMAMEARGSQIGHDLTIYMDSFPEAALAATIRDFTHLRKTDIVTFDSTIPYDMEFDRGVFPQEVLQGIINLWPYYQHAFTKEGVYKVSLAPLTYYDPVVLNARDMSQLVIDEGGDNEFSQIANAIEVWGQELDAQYTATKCVTSGGVYQLTIDEKFKVLENGMTVSFTPDKDSRAGQQIQIQSTKAGKIYVARGDGTVYQLPPGEMKKDVAYCVKYAGGKFILQGELLIHAIAMEFNREPTPSQKEAFAKKYDCANISYVINPDSRFACDREGLGVVKRVRQGGDYDAIYTTQLALERARYELWCASRLQNSKRLNCIFVPWLDVNQKVEYTSLRDGTTRQYLVEKIEAGLEGTMSVTISQFFPLYQWLNGSVWGGVTAATWGDIRNVKWGNLDEYTPPVS